jgi:hypothetical protein
VTITLLESTFTIIIPNVDSKALTGYISPLSATVTKNRGEA